MFKKMIAAASAAAFSLCLTATASSAMSLEAGETMGLAALSPLPEGIYLVDNYNYGGTNAQRLGVNIPLGVWSTPWTFANSRIEFLVAVPTANLDGGVNHFGLITEAFGVVLAHDFGGGFSGGVTAILRTPDPDPTLSAITGRTAAAGDFRAGLYYSKDGWNLAETTWFTSSFGADRFTPGCAYCNDTIGVDYSITRTFDKLEVGFVGYTFADTTNYFGNTRTEQTELGGLIGYNFGPVTVQAMVTHAIYTKTNGVQAGTNETRGWLRLIVPLWTAPTQVAAAPLRTRY